MLPLCSYSSLDLFQPGQELIDFSGRWRCSPLTAAVALSRGEEASPFDDENLGTLLRSLYLSDAAARMSDLWRQAVPGRRVFIYGDYDVDGVSSATLALKLVQETGAASSVYYIPRRSTEGYGLNVPAVQAVIDRGFETMIVTDCGSKDREAVALAREAGLRVLVFDHHLVEGELADPDCLLNPQLDGDSQARTLCATAVLWCWAMKSGLFSPARVDYFSQLAALATVSDCMPLEALNRALIRRGLDVTRARPLPGLSRLYEALKLELQGLNEEDWAMKVVPCLNAPGRLAFAEASVALLCGDGDLTQRVQEVLNLNRRRRDLASQITAALTQKIDDGETRQVFYDGTWPVGLLSAVASRLCSARGQGFALASRSGNSVRGTLRVPEGANAVQLLKELDPLLDHWGGHQFAAGFSASPARWPQVSEKLNRALCGLDLPELREEAIQFAPNRVTPGDMNDLGRLGPFGKGNPLPLFFTPKGNDVVLPLGKQGRHSKVVNGGAELLAFDAARQLEDLSGVVGWLYRPRLEYWQGVPRAKFFIEKIVTED